MNTMKTFLLMAVMTILLVFVGRLIGGQNGMVMAFLFAMIMNFGSYWFSDKIVLKMYGAQEVTRTEQPELVSMVEELSGRAGLPMPKVYVIPNEQPNAFATGRNPDHAAVAVTEGIMKTLSRDELRGVLGHELTHVKHRDILIGTIAATLAGAISMLASMAQWGMMFGGGRSSDREGGSPIAGLVMMIVAPIAAMMIQMAISRSREYDADAGGAQVAGNPLSPWPAHFGNSTSEPARFPWTPALQQHTCSSSARSAAADSRNCSALIRRWKSALRGWKQWHTARQRRGELGAERCHSFFFHCCIAFATSFGDVEPADCFSRMDARASRSV